MGRRWYERSDDGNTCGWGRVLAWEPPARLSRTAAGTRVELEHRHLDRYGKRRDEMRGIFDSEGGWTALLAAFSRAAAA